MKKIVLCISAFLMLGTITTFGQTVNGPGYFETYTEDFEDNVYVDQTWTFAKRDKYSFENMTNVLVPEGQIWLMSSVADGNICMYDGATFENYTASVIICPRYGNMMGLVFNYQDENNFYYIHLVSPDGGGANLAYIGQKVNGFWNLKGTFSNLLLRDVGEGGDAMFADPIFGPRSNKTTDWGFQRFSLASSIALKISNNAGKTSVWIAGNLVFDEVSTPLFTKGKIGLFAANNPTFFDNLVVTANAPNVPTNNPTLISNQNIDIYPNPVVANGNFTIKTPVLNSNSKVEIYDITGKMVFSQIQLNTSELKMNSKNLSGKGVYNVKVTSGNKVSNSKLIVK